MERFTVRFNDKVFYTKGRYPETIPAECESWDVRNILNKLAEYEDTGLTPDEINVLKIENEILKAEITQLKEPKKICFADIDIDDPGR